MDIDVLAFRPRIDLYLLHSFFGLDRLLFAHFFLVDLLTLLNLESNRQT